MTSNGLHPDQSGRIELGPLYENPFSRIHPENWGSPTSGSINNDNKISPLSDLVAMIRKRPRMDYEDPKGETDKANPETIGSFEGDVNTIWKNCVCKYLS